MKKSLILICVGIMLATMVLHADKTVTVSATSADISENLDLRTVATLFGQAKDLEEFEQVLNNPDSAFSNLDLNGDGDVDYLRVVETADGNRHLIVIQAVLAKDIYQDVASIYVEKDESEQVTIQVIGDEYIYGANYIIEPVYIYRPLIYDWFWGPSWVCWHSPYYWDYWPGWWRPYHCIAHHLYWDHCYWYHHHYPICTYRTAHHHHAHYGSMRDRVRRNDFATRHPERGFASRNASRGVVNARALEQGRRTAVREAMDRTSSSRGTATRVNNTSRVSDRTFGSSAVRTASGSASRVSGTAGTVTRSAGTATRSSSTTKRSSATTPARSSVTTTRSSATSPSRTSVTTTPRRSANTTVTHSSSSTPSRSASSAVRSGSSSTRSSSSAVRSSSSSSMRSSGGSAVRSGGYSSGGSRSSGGGYSSGESRSSGGSRTR